MAADGDIDRGALDELVIEAMDNIIAYNEGGAIEGERSEVLQEVYTVYKAMYETSADYSWSMLYQVLHEEKKAHYGSNGDGIVAQLPEDIEYMLQNVKNAA